MVILGIKNLGNSSVKEDVHSMRFCTVLSEFLHIFLSCILPGNFHVLDYLQGATIILCCPNNRFCPLSTFKKPSVCF